ncbi:hypothetical protein [Nostoc sp.]|uniref:hypothetical protein n=1 Tax=Nostoc sp. TaxID=1180 RepID=UPI002FFC1309
MSIATKKFRSLLVFLLVLPALFIGLAFLTKALHYAAVIFAIRPIVGSVKDWFGQQLSFWLNPMNFISLIQLTGIVWLNFLIGCLLYGFLAFGALMVSLLFHGLMDEPEVKQIFGQTFLFITFLPFSLTGTGLSTLYLLSSPAIFRVLTFTTTLFLCFLTTSLDFLQIVTLGYKSAFSVNIFTDQPDHVIAHIAGSIIYTNSFLDWINEDHIVIHNFLEYWFYSLRASVLAARCEGWLQMLAFIINSIFSVLYFLIGYNASITGSEEQFKKDDKNNLRTLVHTDFKLLGNMLALLIIVALISLGFRWIFQGSVVNT